MLPSLPYLFSCDSAQFFCKRRPHRKPEGGLHPHPFWSYFFCWESEGRIIDGCLETPKSGCLWGSFTFKDAHWKAEPWPQQAGRCQADTQWSEKRKALLFSSLFQREVPGDCISMSNLHGEQQGTQGVGGGEAWPSLPTCFQTLTWLVGCTFAGVGNYRAPFLVLWKSSCPAVFYFTVIVYPARGNVLSILLLLSMWFDKSSLVNKGLGHLFWEIQVPRTTPRVLFSTWMPWKTEFINSTNSTLCEVKTLLWEKNT